jgi:hypothetical protein
MATSYTIDQKENKSEEALQIMLQRNSMQISVQCMGVDNLRRQFMVSNATL